MPGKATIPSKTLNTEDRETKIFHDKTKFKQYFHESSPKEDNRRKTLTPGGKLHPRKP